jgi:hypothetical protein
MPSAGKSGFAELAKRVVRQRSRFRKSSFFSCLRGTVGATRWHLAQCREHKLEGDQRRASHVNPVEALRAE